MKSIRLKNLNCLMSFNIRNKTTMSVNLQDRLKLNVRAVAVYKDLIHQKKRFLRKIKVELVFTSELILKPVIFI